MLVQQEVMVMSGFLVGKANLVLLDALVHTDLPDLQDSLDEAEELEDLEPMEIPVRGNISMINLQYLIVNRFYVQLTSFIMSIYIGFRGQPGPVGPSGFPGLNGLKGQRGALGAIGQKGVNGHSGRSGPDGSSGKS